MNENVIDNLIDDLALEGEKGCTFQQLFEFVKESIIKSLETTTLLKPLCFDDKYNAYLWTHLQLIDQLIFTENEMSLDPALYTFKEMQSKSASNSVVIKASKDAQERSIFGNSKIDKMSLTENQKALLNLIAKNRQNGIIQSEIMEELGMDPKTLFYNSKKLEGLDLIVKISVYKGFAQHIKVYLKRFAPQQDKEDSDDLYPVENIPTDIIRHLTNANNNIMSLQSLIKAMGFESERQARWARIKINKLHDKGVIEKVFAYDGKKKVSSVQLPKISNNKVEEDAVKDLEPIPDSTTKQYKENLLRDLPADYQFYQDIIAAAEKGLVRQDFVNKYPNIDPGTFQSFLENASSLPATKEHEKYCIYRSEELDGRNRLYRYFSLQGWKKFNEKLGKQVTEQQVSTAMGTLILVEPPSIDYIGKSYNILPSTKSSPCRSKKTKKRNNAEEETEPNTPAKKLRTPSKKTTDTSSEIDSPLATKVTRKRGIQQENSSDPSQESEESPKPKKKRASKKNLDQVEQSNESLEPSHPSNINVEPDNAQVTDVSVTPIEPLQPTPSDTTLKTVREQPSRKGKTITSYFQRKKPIEPVPTPVDQPETNVPEPISADQPETNVSESVSAEQQEVTVPESAIPQLQVIIESLSSVDKSASSTEPQPTDERNPSRDTSTEVQPDMQIIPCDPALVKSSRAKKPRSTSSEINSTKLRRCKILMDMMEEQHIRELNTATWKEFNEIEMAMPGGQKMAIVTFTKMAKQLHAEKKLTVYASTIQKLYGLTEIKTFLLHASVSPESEEMKQFISEYSSERTTTSNRGKKKQLKNIYAEELPQPVKPLKVKNLAVHYGWIKSKWVRARRLHENLMLYYLDSNRNDHIIDMVEYTKYMPVKLITCICSNLPYSEPEFRDFLDDPNNATVSLYQLPENIQSLIFQSRARIRAIVIYLIRVLEALSVVEAMHLGKEDELKVAPKYILSQEAPIRDYAFKDRALVKMMPLKNMQDINSFWDELYTTCIDPSRYRTEQDEKELLESVNKDDPLYYIHQRRGWIVEVVLTEKQKELLDSYIDMETKAIPSDNPALRSHLANETGLTTKRIRSYYNGILGAFNKIQKKDQKLKRKERRQAAMMSDSTINDLMLASFESRKIDSVVQKAKEENPFARSTFVGSRKLRKLRVRTELDSQNHDINSVIYKRPTHNFSDEEKDLLIYSYCIMKARAKKYKFSWNPITSILTNRNKKQCRRVINNLLVNPDLVVKVEKLKSKWERYYKEGLELKDIEDKESWNTYNFNLIPYVEYFIRRILEDERNKDTVCKCPLPLRYEELQKYCFIYRDEQHIVEAKKVADNQALSVNIFNDAIYDTSCVITRETSDDISIEVVKTLVKMLLVTSDTSYDANKAYKIMGQYPLNTIEKATDILRSEGLIIKDKWRYDRIPGRSFNVSEKYLRLAEGVAPFGLIDTARNYYNTLLRNETMDLKNLNSGMVASLLDLASQKKISVDIKKRDLLKSKKSMYYPRRSTGVVKLGKVLVYRDLDLCIKKISQLEPVEPIDKPEYLNTKITLLDSNQTKTILQNLENRLTKDTYEAIKFFKESGGSFSDIMTHLGDKYDKNDICNAIYSLIRHEPPLVRIVGFKQLRYVTTEYCAPWFIQSGEDSTFINPLMWNDVSGEINESALDGCSKAVISHILMLPGISHTNLQKRFEGFFSEYELYTLMRYLVDNKTVIARKVQRQTKTKKPSIFEKRRVASVSQPIDLMNNNEMTFYWLSNNYYLLK